MEEQKTKYYLADAVRYCMDKGIFTVQDGSLDYGCVGIACHFHGGTFPDREFYFDEYADDYESANEYLQNVDADTIAKRIADEFEEMIHDTSFLYEMNDYLFKMYDTCKADGQYPLIKVLDNSIADIRKVVEEEMELE